MDELVNNLALALREARRLRAIYENEERSEEEREIALRQSDLLFESIEPQTERLTKIIKVGAIHG